MSRFTSRGVLGPATWFGGERASARWGFAPIKHQPRFASSADQPDAISHIGDVGSLGYVGAIKVSSTSRTSRLRAAGESFADTIDFLAPCSINFGRTPMKIRA